MNENGKKLAQEIEKAESILILFSANPSIDELSAGIGLSGALDSIGKNVNAVYSGNVPSTIEFLNPDVRLNKDLSGLQDFVITINKDKADHLRYKLEGDSVNVYITPYKSSISKDDLSFSHGDFNVDLVIGLNIEKQEMLDNVLNGHEDILKNASVVNISLNPGASFGGTVWSRDNASSVSEMCAELLFEVSNDISPDAATAFLTGVVNNTDRFSNEKTFPQTMAVASKLMEMGADQQLISAQMEEKAEFRAQGGGDGEIDIEHEEPSVNSPISENGLNVPSQTEVKPSLDLGDATSSEAQGLGNDGGDQGVVQGNVPFGGALMSNNVGEETLGNSVISEVNPAQNTINGGENLTPVQGSAEKEVIGAIDSAMNEILGNTTQNASQDGSQDVSNVMNEILGKSEQGENQTGVSGRDYIGAVGGFNPASMASPSFQEVSNVNSGEVPSQPMRENAIKTINPIGTNSNEDVVVQPTISTQPADLNLGTTNSTNANVGGEEMHLPLPDEGNMPTPPTPPVSF